MRKTLFLMLALLASVTSAFAQSNLAQGKNAYASSVSTEAGRTGWTAEKAVDGDAGTQWASDYTSEGMTDDQRNAQWLYVDLGSEQTVNTVSIQWDNQPASNFDIRYSTTDPASNPKATGTVALSEQSGNGGSKNIYTFASAVTARYIILDLKQRATGWGYGIVELGVYNVTEALAVTTVEASISSSSVRIGETANVTYKAYDQVGGAITPTSVTYTSSNAAVATVGEDGVVTAVAEGTATITVTADGKTATVNVTVEAALVLPTTAPAAPTGTEYVIYDGTTGKWADAGWGWGGNAQSDITIDGKVCRMGQKLGGMQIENPLKDYTNYSKLVVDVWSAASHTFYVFFEGEGTRKQVELVAGWNKTEIETSGIDGSKVSYLTFQYSENPKDGVLIFSNVYYSADGVQIDETISTFTASVENVIVNTATDLGLTIKNATGMDISSLVEVTTDNGTIEKGVLTAATVGTATITAKGTKNTKTLTINVLDEVKMPTIPTEPTADAENVLAVFSAHYGVTDLRDAMDGWGTTGFSGASRTKSEIIELPDGDYKIVHIVGNYMNSRPAGSTATTGYTKAYVAIYPTTATSGKVFEDNNYNNGVSFSGLTPGQWNYIEVPVTFNANFVLVSLDNETEFYLDNFYFTKPAEDAVEVTVTSNGVAKVVGPVTNAKVSEILTEAGNAPVIDFSGATVKESITITPANKNAVVVVNGEGRTPGQTVTANNLVVFQSPWYRAATGTQIVYTDSNDDQPQTAFTIDAKDDGFKITREVEANKTVTAFYPVAATVTSEEENAVSIYTFADANASGVAFNLLKNGDDTNATTIPAGTPVIIVTTAAATITAEANNDLDLTKAATTEAINGVTFCGNYATLTTNGTQYVVSGDKLVKANGAKIGAFRAYFTGLSAASARILLNNGEEATGIRAIDSQKGHGQEVFDLQGRRVATPQKGLYIVNGKKMVIK